MPGCRFWFLAGIFLLLTVVAARSGGAASALESLTIGYSSFSGHYVPLWIAVDDRLGKKYGFELKAVYAGRARPQQLLMSGETPLVVATGTGALTSHVLGVKDQVIVLVFVNKVPGVIVARPEIKSAEDLRGKVIGTGRPGALADTMVRYVLRSKLNLVPDRDVRLLPVGEPALALQSMERGVVDAASFSGPQALMAKKMGFRELVSYDKLGIVYPYNTVTTLRQTITKQLELVERVLKALIEGIAVFRTNKQKSIAIWRRYLRGASDEILEESYQSTLAELEPAPMPSPGGDQERSRYSFARIPAGQADRRGGHHRCVDHAPDRAERLHRRAL